MVTGKLVESALSQLGLTANRWSVAGVLCQRRSKNSPEVLEGIRVDWAGSRSEAVFASVECAVVAHGYPSKGLVKSAAIEEVATDKERLWTIIEANPDAVRWVERLVAVADSKIVSHSATFSTILLEETADAREASRAYAEFATRAEIGESGAWWEIARAAGVCQFEDGFYYYAKAAKAILENWKTVEPAGETPFDFERPITDRELSSRLQITVSKLIETPGP